MNIQHSMLTGVHYTPVNLIKKTHRVLGGIDLDPCSSRHANSYIKAKEYFTKWENGLSQAWTTRTVTSTRIHKGYNFFCKHEPASIFINPPGSKYLRPSLSMQFWQKLMSERERGNVRAAVWIAYSIEQLQQSQNLKGFPSLMKFAICIPKARVKFWDYRFQSEDSPTHGNAIIYIPGIENCTDLFYEEFSEIGDIR